MQGYCAGQIQMILASAITFDDEHEHCAPTDVKLGQVARVVVDFMDNNAAFLHLPFSALAHHAIRTAWPCR
jgi:hypothetical protein